jgi:hypothetical protein
VRGLRFTHPAIAALAEKHRKAPAQVLLRYAVQKGFVAIPKSASKARIAANADIFDFALSAAELAHLDTLDEGASPSALRGPPLWSCALGVLHHCGAYYPISSPVLEPRRAGTSLHEASLGDAGGVLRTGAVCTRCRTSESERL